MTTVAGWKRDALLTSMTSSGELEFGWDDTLPQTGT